jgi:hypothetical protein
MPFYQRLGDLPRKRHIVHRDNGTLLTEEVMGFEGFSGLESILYHLESPCRVNGRSGCPMRTLTVISARGTCLPPAMPSPAASS